ncbi:MAG: restriction endonuclease subunit S [Gammaproteobacteria bacterium]|nr:restriction endonuclease subunit S [Gammaproteobacteria bacterium]MBU1724805.1 restriction endonuclease subunit S [Gammaproteobacteria bacterium]MBU2006532.1 restriction endonuclease subunit S [Gammaproteobacteria bacterium]
MIPQGWQSTEIGKLVDFKSGGTPSKTKPEFWGGSNPWISGKDLKQHYISSSIDMLSEEGFAVVSKAPKGSSLILVRGMTLLKDFPVGFVEEVVSFNQDIKALIPKKSIDGLFLSFLLVGKKEEIRQLVSTAGHGTGRLDTESIKSFPVDIPPLSEQKKIAKIFSTWDKAITTTEQLLANSQQQKKALMQQLLTGKKRLMGFGGEWKYSSINEIATRIQRKSDGNKHPILTISSLGGFVRQDERYSRYMAGESVKNYILLKNGEFAYNKGNSKTYEFGCIFDLEKFESGLVPHVYVCFKLKKGLSHRYFKYLFEADYLKLQLGALVNTGVRNNGLLNIKPSEFLATRVPVPNVEEQERIADILYASSLVIKSLQQKLEGLKQEKKALMQQLLTGKRRVKA